MKTASILPQLYPTELPSSSTWRDSNPARDLSGAKEMGEFWNQVTVGMVRRDDQESVVQRLKILTQLALTYAGDTFDPAKIFNMERGNRILRVDLHGVYGSVQDQAAVYATETREKVPGYILAMRVGKEWGAELPLNNRQAELCLKGKKDLLLPLSVRAEQMSHETLARIYFSNKLFLAKEPQDKSSIEYGKFLRCKNHLQKEQSQIINELVKRLPELSGDDFQGHPKLFAKCVIDLLRGEATAIEPRCLYSNLLDAYKEGVLVYKSGLNSRDLRDKTIQFCAHDIHPRKGEIVALFIRRLERVRATQGASLGTEAADLQ